MPILNILSIVFPVFSIIGIGYLFARFKKLSLEPVIDILLYITIPSLIVSSLVKKKFIFGEIMTVSLAALIVMAGTGIMSFVYLKIINKKELRGFYLPTMFMNSGNMAFPLALLAFGEEGLAVAVIYYVAVSIMVYSLGIHIAKGKGGFYEIFKLPLIYATTIGMILNFTEITLPKSMLLTVDMLGAATIPLMLISLGYQLHSTHITSFGMSISGTVIRIFGGTMLAYFATMLFSIGGLEQNIIILSSSMPSAVINFIMSYKYKLDYSLVASVIALSTIVSLFTTPILLYLLM
ncbi:MAG: AEC family transporter [Deltaproteobacteria bacterium]|nr:AEC family transporter [Deltaproteobacteria bacterium]